MTAPRTKLLAVGLDAVESPLLETLMAAGRLPNLESLANRGVGNRVTASCMSTLPGAIWQDILTGTSAWRHGDYYPLRLHTGESAVRSIDSKAHRGNYYFDRLAGAGLDSIVIDQPLVPAYTPSAPMTLVSEWHVHDAIWERGTHPPELLAELESRFGKRPYDRCDTNHDATDDSLTRFASMLKTELAIKIDMVEHLMATRSWDHVAVGLSQGHCAGHQLWALHDAARSAPSGTGSVPDDLLVGVYEALDQAIGRLISAAGPGCGVVVFTSHGMENYVGGPQLLPRLLEAWGQNSPSKGRSLMRKLIPKRLLGRIFLAAPWLMKAAADRGAWTDHLTSDTTAIAVPNNRVGAIRLNVAGREPDGVITDTGSAMSELEERLRVLRHHPGGEPVVEEVIRTADHFPDGMHPDVPDLLVVFRRDLGEITAVTCPDAGRLSVPIRSPHYQRTGDHTDESRIWIDHPRVEAIDALRSEDIAPTLMALLDVDPPDDLDGRVAVRFGEPARR